MGEKLAQRTLRVDGGEVKLPGLAKVAVVHRQRAEKEVCKEVHREEDERLRVRVEDGTESIDVLFDRLFGALKGVKICQLLGKNDGVEEAALTMVRSASLSKARHPSAGTPLYCVATCSNPPKRQGGWWAQPVL
jgi:hypothetical protein